MILGLSLHDARRLELFAGLLGSPIVIVPGFSTKERSQAAGVPIFAVACCIRERATGTLFIQNDRIVRQFAWAGGHCSGASCNAKSELPGTFLHKEGRLTQEQYESYLRGIRAPKADLLDLAIRGAALNDSDAQRLKAAYALRIAKVLL